MKVLIGLLAASSIAAPALAKDPIFVTATSIKDKEVTVAGDKAYILMRADNLTPLYIMKIPSADDRATYDRLRAEAFQKAREQYLQEKKSYDAAGSDGKAAKPVEVTEASFSYPAFEQLAGFSMGVTNRFAKGKDGLSTYLEEVTPGEYRVYGTLTQGSGSMGVCFCMGSVAFTAKAGEVVDLGSIGMVPIGINGQAASGKNATREVQQSGGADLRRSFFEATPSDVPTDPRLAKAKIVAARFRPVGKLPNYFGVLLARIPAMPGVMRYERDKIIDLTIEGN